MAVYTKHPASAPPAAPVRETTGHLMLRGWCIFVLFTALSGTAWLHAFGDAADDDHDDRRAVVLSVVLWIVVRPPVQWRRLPWFTIAYVAWATLSILWSHWREATALTLLLLVRHDDSGAVHRQRADLARTRARDRVRPQMGHGAVARVRAVGLDLHRRADPARLRRPDRAADDPIVYWSRDNLFDGGRIQGIMGNANLLGPVALLAIIVFSIRFAAGAPRRTLLGAWIGLSAYLFYRASSATAYVAAVGVAIVLVTVLLMRRATTAGRAHQVLHRLRGHRARRRARVLAAARSRSSPPLGRSSDLTGARAIWAAVLERAARAAARSAGASRRRGCRRIPPSTGGSSTTARPSCRRTTCGSTCSCSSGSSALILMGAHLPRGRLALLVLRRRPAALGSARRTARTRRSRCCRRSSARSCSCRGSPSRQPAAARGAGCSWSCFAFKIKQSPHVGVGPAEQSVAIERGELTKQVP